VGQSLILELPTNNTASDGNEFFRSQSSNCSMVLPHFAAGSSTFGLSRPFTTTTLQSKINSQTLLRIIPYPFIGRVGSAHHPRCGVRSTPYSYSYSNNTTKQSKTNKQVLLSIIPKPFHRIHRICSTILPESAPPVSIILENPATPVPSVA